MEIINVLKSKNKTPEETYLIYKKGNGSFRYATIKNGVLELNISQIEQGNLRIVGGGRGSPRVIYKKLNEKKKVIEELSDFPQENSDFELVYDKEKKVKKVDKIEVPISQKLMNYATEFSPDSPTSRIGQNGGQREMLISSSNDLNNFKKKVDLFFDIMTKDDLSEFDKTLVLQFFDEYAYQSFSEEQARQKVDYLMSRFAKTAKSHFDDINGFPVKNQFLFKTFSRFFNGGWELPESNSNFNSVYELYLTYLVDMKIPMSLKSKMINNEINLGSRKFEKILSILNGQSDLYVNLVFYAKTGQQLNEAYLDGNFNSKKSLKVLDRQFEKLNQLIEESTDIDSLKTEVDNFFRNTFFTTSRDEIFSSMNTETKKVLHRKTIEVLKSFSLREKVLNNSQEETYMILYPLMNFDQAKAIDPSLLDSNDKESLIEFILDVAREPDDNEGIVEDLKEIAHKLGLDMDDRFKTVTLLKNFENCLIQNIDYQEIPK